jgi:shikimate 5-dehydrogenase
MSNALALQPQTQPTMVFIGVTTGSSAMMRIFPRWSEVWGLGAQLLGYDAPLHADPQIYRAVVEHIKHDAMTVGGLVTTHKIDLLAACRDLFDVLDPYAQMTGEVSSISKQDGRLIGHAKDPITSGLSWDAFVPSQHFSENAADVLCFGGGGAAGAISVYVSNAEGRGRPKRFLIVDISEERLAHIRATHAKLNSPLNFEYILHERPEQNDALMREIAPRSLVINATGMGKDRPGSPITDKAQFPQDGLVWELNYRGELTFLQQARAQATSRNLKVEDGWVYFLYGWSAVVAEVFHVPLTPQIFAKLNHVASEISR